MKTYLAMTAVLVSMWGLGSAIADETFNKKKTEAITEIDERIQKLQEHKTCISGATTPDALKQCRASMKTWRESERLEHMEKRKARIEERMQRMKDKKE